MYIGSAQRMARDPWGPAKNGTISTRDINQEGWLSRKLRFQASYFLASGSPRDVTRRQTSLRHDEHGGPAGIPLIRSCVESRSAEVPKLPNDRCCSHPVENGPTEALRGNLCTYPQRSGNPRADGNTSPWDPEAVNRSSNSSWEPRQSGSKSLSLLVNGKDYLIPTFGGRRLAGAQMAAYRLRR